MKRARRTRTGQPCLPAIVAGTLLAGCASVTPPLPAATTSLDGCRNLFHSVDKAVANAGVRDQGPFPISGFPYLRVTRFYASFRDTSKHAARFSAWTKDLATLDADARHFELRNLPTTAADRLGTDIEAKLNDCRTRLIDADLATPAQRSRLRRQAEVPNDYLGWQRLVGLYPLTSLFVSAGITRWHREARHTFATPLEKLPVEGALVRWRTPKSKPLDAHEVQIILQHSTDPLGIPRPDAATLDRLFETFAPVWEVDVADHDDRIGSPVWRSGRLQVDTDRPAVYRKLSYSRFHGRVLLQLNYIVWFPARNSDDIYGGRFDGIDFRVTLGTNGKPLLYDAMHNCGCYHEFFPGHRLQLKKELGGVYFEPPLVPQPAPDGSPLVLRIAHQTHYIQRLYPAGKAQPVERLAWRDYDMLRSLTYDGGHRSMFGPGGIVPGSERPERFVLWPMGVRSPGAMRQWGRHDTAFVGQRHFDDPFLIESLFEEVAP